MIPKSFSGTAVFAVLLCLNFMESESFQEDTRRARPVIAIIGQKITDEKVLQRYPHAKGKSYIAASYVKFIESAGARVMPLSDATNISDVKDVFQTTNGVLFPGGIVNLLSSGYQRLAKKFFELIQEASKHSDYYPLLGECLGMQQEAVLIAGKNILRRTESYNIGLPMTFTKAAYRSRLFEGMSPEVENALSWTSAPFNNHRYSILPRSFARTPSLDDFFEILSTSRDENGREFVASMEAKEYPIFGIQWHPEKTLFEWNTKLNIDRSQQAVEASQYIANRFVQFAKENKHTFPSPSEDLLIYHYQPLYTGDISSFEQIYVI